MPEAVVVCRPWPRLSQQQEVDSAATWCSKRDSSWAGPKGGPFNDFLFPQSVLSLLSIFPNVERGGQVSRLACLQADGHNTQST